MGAIEGVIILSSTNEPILHSQFSHPLSNYPHLHVDTFIAKLEAVTSEQHVLSPVLYTDTIPNRADIEDEDVEHDVEEGTSVNSASHASSARRRGATLVHIERNHLRFLATFSEQLDPLLPLTFLHKLVFVMELYFGSPLTEASIRDNFDVVYQLLEEMLDESGEPLNTEYNTLRELVHEPSWLSSVINKMGALSGLSTNAALGSAMSEPRISSIPWRRPESSRSRQSRHEIYVDVVETLSAVYSRGSNAQPVGAISLQCTLDSNSKLGGMPDVQLQLSNTERITDASLHACVRLRSWQKDRILHFIPPDGNFELAKFRMQSVKALQKHIPLLLACSKTANEGDDKTQTIDVKIIVSCSAPVEDVDVSFSVSNSASLESSLFGGSRPGLASEDLSALKGTFHFDARTGLARWTIGSLSVDQRPLELRATIKGDRSTSLSNCVSSTITIGQKSLSGLKVSSLEVVNDVGYKPFKGVRSIVKGSIDWRW